MHSYRKALIGNQAVYWLSHTVGFDLFCHRSEMKQIREIIPPESLPA